MPYYSVTIEAELNGIGGGWTALSDDVLNSVPIQISYGIDGSGPLDRIAGTGSAVFALDNSEENSAATQGYYSPDNAGVRGGWGVGIRIRVSITYSGTTYYKFIGTLESIAQLAGHQTTRTVVCTVLDWMDEAAKQKTANIPTQTGKRTDEIISTIVANMTRQPVSASYAAAQLEYPYALDTSEDESTSAMTEIAKAVYSDMGYLYIIGDTSSGGVLRYDDRRVRQSAASVLTTLSDTAEINVKRARSEIFNRVKVSANPRRADANATTVLYQYDSAQLLALGPSESATIIGQYRDPDQRAQRVGGVDLVSPVAGTDYAFGTGTGDTSLTADLGVSVSAGGNSVIITLTNNAAVSGFVTLLQIRGRGLYAYDPVTVQATDNASRTAYGESVLTLDLPHEARQHVASSMASVFLDAYKDPRTYINSVSFDANASDALMTAALAREPGDLVSIAETETGLNVNQFINGVRYEIDWPRMICTWIVAPDLDTATVFILDTSTLNGAHVLGW